MYVFEVGEVVYMCVHGLVWSPKHVFVWEQKEKDDDMQMYYVN